MNTGAFGEGFPYSNFHDLNMDWIIKIAKDFLDQYSHIQEVIATGEQSLLDKTETGIEQLESKANTLETLLQAWYDTHSQDIANELADAISDLDDWYTQHQNYLNETLQIKIAEFESLADLKAQRTIATIPDDYSTFFASALKYSGALVANEDLDNVTANTYYSVPSTGVLNTPVNKSGYVFTCGDTSALATQIYVTLEQTSSRMYIRRHVTAGWQQWKLQNDIYYGAVTSGSFNDLPAQSIYYKNINATVTDAPTTKGGFVYTFGDVSAVAQQFFITAASTKCTMYVRRHNNYGWGDWENLTDIYHGVMTITSDCNNMTAPSIYFKPIGVGLNAPTEDSGLIYTMGDTDYVGQQIFITTKRSNNDVYVRRVLPDNIGDWELLNSNESTHNVRILFIGNSLTQDAISYLPYMLKTYYQDIKFTFYIWYNGGATLGDQYTKFQNNETADIFSVADNTSSWTNYSGNSGKTMMDVLNSYEFDIVCMQEYFNHRTNYTEQDLVDWNNCRNYIRNNYSKNGLEFISLFHAPLRSNALNVYNLTTYGNNLILQNTISDDMIPAGIAIYKAMQTSLDNLGDEGHLSPDGTHAQEGLPCLMQTMTTLCWLLNRMGLPANVYCSPARMTTAIYETLNVPGPNLGTGVITGTDNQNLLSQQVAIESYKQGKKEVLNNI